MAYTENNVSKIKYAELLLAANENPRNSAFQYFLSEWNSLDMKLYRARLEIMRNQTGNRSAFVRQYVPININKFS